MTDGISICIPTFSRPQMLKESFENVLSDPRVKEVVICDDCSPIHLFEEERILASKSKKIKLYRNKANLDCYRNKRQAVELASSPWVILLDDDNVVRTDYLDALWKLGKWDHRVIYMPEFAKPHFNYTHFSGQMVSRKNVRGLFFRQHFKCALNTCNYFLHRDTYLEAWNGSVNPHTSDTMFHAFNHLSKGGEFYFVPGLSYFHRIHSGSHFKNNHKKTGAFAHQVESLIFNLR